jgi:cytochrome c553
MNRLVMMAVLGAMALAASGARAQAGAGQAVVGNAQAAQGKVAMCIGCHGIPDYRVAFPRTYRVPKLGGQSAQYIMSALHGYKDGTRNFPTMHAVAASLSDQDIADIAAYYAAQTPTSDNNPLK